MTWFIADTHYSHKNIVRGTSNWADKSGCRDFDTLYDHNRWLIDSINRNVARQDTLWHLGDWSFGGKEMIKEFRDQLNCERIHLVYGNHDHHQQAAFGDMDLLFQSRQHYKELTIGKISLVLMHYPLESWNNMERGVHHLHGHVHGQGAQMCGRIDVGVDAVGLVNLDDIAARPLATTQRHASIEGGNKFA